MALTANFDGACEPVNPGGTGGWGFVIYSTPRIEGCGIIPAGPTMTNNVAEYRSALEMIRAYLKHRLSGPLVARGDSKLVVMQMSGLWRVRGGHYISTYRRLDNLVSHYEVPVRWVWVPREENTDADDLSKQGLRSRGVQARAWRT